MARAGYPLYLQLKSWLIERISSGEWPEGTMIPTEQELMLEHGVSRTTVRQAVLDLVSSGDLIRRQGKGTYVARPDHIFTSSPLYGFKEEFDYLGRHVDILSLQIDLVPADIAIATHLRVSIGTPVIHVGRIVSEAGDPIFADESYLPESLRHVCSEEQLRHGSIFSALEAHGIAIASGEQIISAENASTETAQKLHCAVGDAVIHIMRTTKNGGGQPIEYSIARYRADAYEYRIRLARTLKM
ncbi:GntR family transcriptional regulator [Sulfoacidibacillus ferrooxidans]|nr:GntR family transcriptional regulator [Sulfoacidibacillus ferrooxidans]